MANEIENDNLSFGIQDTIQMGAGSQDLLSDLVAPETSTANPDDIKDIKTAEAEEAAAKAAEVTAAAEEAAKKVKKVEKDESLGDFLSGEDEEEEEEEEDGATKAAKSAAKADDIDPAGGEEEEDTSTTPFEAISNELIELGVFSANEEGADPIATPEAFLEKFQSEKKQGAMDMVDNFIGQFGQEHQDAFDAIYVKGIDPKEYFTSTAKIADFSSLDMTQENNQESVIRQALTDQGFDPEDVDSEVERLKNYGDLETVSQKHHKVLIKNQTKGLAEKTAAAEREQQNKANTKQEYVGNVNTVLQAKIKEKGFDGIPLNPKIANELQDFLLVDKWKTDSGETLTDFDKYILELKRPENHETKVKVGLLLKLLEKDPTLSTIQKSGVTKKSNTLFKEVSRQVSKAPSNKKTSSSWFK